MEVQTNVDFAAEHRGKFTDEASARAYMAAHGWADVDEVVDAYLPRRAIDAGERALRGDVMLFAGELGNVVGLSMGLDSWVIDWHGARRIPSKLAVAAWRVG